MNQTIRRWISAVTTLGAMVGSACGQCDSRRPFQVSVDQSSGRCTVIKFPEWKFAGYPYGLHYFVFRRAADGRYIVAAEGSGAISLNKSFLSVDANPRVAPATDQDWNRATEMEWVKWSEVFPNQGEKASATGVLEYQGKPYRRSGPHWVNGGHEALPSLEKTWLIVQSMDGSISKEDPGSGPESGTVFTEVFRASTGEKVSTVTARFCGWQSSSYYNEVGWLSDRHLVISGGIDGRAMVFCDLGSH